MKQAVILNPSTTLAMSMQGIKLVEASAGTGKTFAIGNLYLRMILDGLPLENILVVTFTNAATEELRGRIRKRIYEALQQWEHDTSDGTDKDELLTLWQEKAQDEALKQGKFRLKLALSSMDNAAIYTIHAFCQKMLTEHAFHSGQAFDIEMLTNDSIIWEEALKDWWRNQIAAMNIQQFGFFEDALGSLESFIRLQQDLRKPAVKLMPEIEQAPEIMLENIQHDLQTLAESWKKEAEIIETILLSGVLKQNKTVYKLANIPSLCETMHHYFSLPDALNIPEALAALKFTELTSALKKGKDGDDLKSPFFALVDDTLPRIQTDFTCFKTKLLAQAHAYACEAVAHKKLQAGQLAFDDQLVHLHRAVLNNPALCASIRERFPMAMIDEFQDTDAIQYGIFNQLYKHQHELGLMMIGDPKQSIYSFRGGDIFTYMRAKADADKHYTLDTNWRSTHALIDAVNHLFSLKNNPFLYEDIPFEVVGKPPEDKPKLQLAQEDVSALTLWQTSNIGSKDGGEKLLHNHVANEIAKLLLQSKQGDLTLDGRVIHAGDIAVLTQNHYQAADLREALHQRGIGAVTAGKQHVFESDEAEGLLAMLQAILHPKDASLARCALASAILAYPAHELYQHIQQSDAWLTWLEKLTYLHDVWQSQGFMPMFQSMVRKLNIGERMAANGNGERRLTNLLHLGELLQQAAQSLTGMEALLAWFEHQCQDDSSNEEAQLRLENDGNLVQISTIHAAKGLEYPIVFVPYIWGCKPRKPEANKLLSYYDNQAMQHCLTLLPQASQLKLAEDERLAEDMRLLYVALTRASQKLYLAWGNIGSDAAKSALIHLLGMPGDANDAEQALDAIEQIDVQELSLETPNMLVLPKPTSQAKELKAQNFSRSLRHDWGISSFSALTRNLSYNHIHADHDADNLDAIFSFPANRYTGLFLHDLMEHLDFQGDLAAQVEQRLPELAAHFGIHTELETITTWVQNIVHTPLSKVSSEPSSEASSESLGATKVNSPSFTLASLAKHQRLNELHFDLSMPNLNVHQLNETLQAASPHALQTLQSFDCKGYLTGEIDMVFEHDGGYFIVDYKSNFLGYHLDDYQAEALQQAIIERRYDVQYLIYSVALHRYLQLRIPDYDYAQHFGGVYYLFLRGMRPEHGCQYGVFAHKPDISLIETLNDNIFGAGAEQ